MQAIKATVHGRVQGVGFRYTARRAAQELGVVGWVRNLTSGAVEVWAQGPDDAVERFTEFLEKGPPGAVVDSVDVAEVEPDPALAGFHITF